jgi:Protein of unknown function (DUF1142).
MNISFDKFGKSEKPEFILCNPDESEIAVITVSETSCIIRFNATSELTFKVYPKYSDDSGTHDHLWYESVKTKRLIFVTDLGYFQIQEVKELDDGKMKYKEVIALSLQNEFTFKKAEIPGGTYKFYNALTPSDDETLIGLVFKQMPGWTLSSVSGSLWNKYRTFEMNTDTSLYDFLVNTVENTYECIFNFDFLNKTVAITDIDDTVKQTDIYLSYDNLIKNIEVTENGDNIITALSVFGQGLDIRKVNPLGSAYIYDFSYYMNKDWMSQDLIDAVGTWQKKIAENQIVYANLLTELQNHNADLISMNSNLIELNGLLATQNNLLSVRITSGNGSVSEIKAEIDRITSNINSLKLQINTKESDISNTNTKLIAINTDLKFENNFTSEQLDILNRFIVQEEYSDNNYIVTDSMTQTQIQNYAQELHEQGQKVLNRLAQPRYTFTLDSVNFLFLEHFKRFSDQLELGSVITIEKETDVWFYPILLEVSFNWDNPDLFEMTFGNRYRLDDSGYTFADLISQSVNSSRSVSANWKDITRFNDYKDEVIGVLKNAWDVSKNAIVSANNQNIVWDESGLLCRYLDPDSGSYHDEQMKIINNQLVFTTDGFNTISTAIGKIALGDGTFGYGIAAEVLLGHLVASNELRISSENNYFIVDGAGATLYNADFTVENEKSKITISPDEGILIQKKLSADRFEDIFYVDENGDAFFAGQLSAASGKIGGWDVSEDGLSHSEGQYYLNSDGTGKIGLMTFNNSSATFDGNIYAKNLQAGSITLPNGNTGDAGYVGDSHIADNSISGTKLRAEYRDSVTAAIAAVEVYANKTFAKIESFTSFQSQVANAITQAETSIKQYSDNKFATITSLTTFQTDVNTSMSAITQDVNVTKSQIALVVGAGKIVDAAGNTSASIIIEAINGTGSTATIRADKINLSGVTTFLKASDVSASGTTKIDGGRVDTLTLAVDRLKPNTQGHIEFERPLAWKTGTSNNTIYNLGGIYFQATYSTPSGPQMVWLTHQGMQQGQLNFHGCTGLYINGSRVLTNADGLNAVFG